FITLLYRAIVRTKAGVTRLVSCIRRSFLIANYTAPSPGDAPNVKHWKRRKSVGTLSSLVALGGPKRIAFSPDQSEKCHGRLAASIFGEGERRARALARAR